MSQDDNGEALAGCGCLIVIVLVLAALGNQDGCKNTNMTDTQRMTPTQRFETRRDAEEVVDEVIEETSVFESVYELVPADQVGPERRRDASGNSSDDQATEGDP